MKTLHALKLRPRLSQALVMQLDMQLSQLRQQHSSTVGTTKFPTIVSTRLGTPTKITAVS